MPTVSHDLRGDWNYPTLIRFGSGRLGELPQACRELGMQRPLLVTDPTLAQLPMVRHAVAHNAQQGLPTAVFSRIKPNPTGDNVDAGTALFRDQGCDGVVALGGGSALDAGKAIGLMAGQRRPLWDFEDVDDWYTRVDQAGMAPVVAVPTTSGTGSEVGRVSVIIDETARKKKLIFHPKILPARVICDPALTVGLPRGLTGAVGMDALSHNLEAFFSPTFHPLAEGIALEGIRLVKEGLRRVLADGDDIVARSQMMAASTMGATAFQKGLGAMHAVAHPVGAHFDTHHGTTIAVLMPYVLEFNRSALAPKLARLARYLDLPGGGYDAVLSWVTELRKEAEIPHTLGELGVTSDAVEELAEQAAADPSGSTNPLALTVENLRRLIERALDG